MTNRALRRDGDSDVGLLQRWFEQGTRSQRVRARIVLERQRGAPIDTVARIVGVHRDTVRRWVGRYHRAGAAGLVHGNAGQLRARRFDSRLREVIRQVASAPPSAVGEAFARWSLYKLRAYLIRTAVVPQISVERLRQILIETEARGVNWRDPFPSRVQVSPEAHLRLRRMARHHVLGGRAAIVLAAAEGRPVKAVAADLGVSENTVRRWIRCFLRGGAPALAKAPGRGQPVVFKPLVRTRIVAIASQSPRILGVARAQWSLASLRQYLVERHIVTSISTEWLRQIIRRAQRPGCRASVATVRKASKRAELVPGTERANQVGGGHGRWSA
jgi:transposase